MLSFIRSKIAVMTLLALFVASCGSSKPSNEQDAALDALDGSMTLELNGDSDSGKARTSSNCLFWF